MLFKRHRRDIFVENEPKENLQPRRSGIFGKSFLAGLENPFLIEVYKYAAPTAQLPASMRQRVGAFFLDVAQTGDAAFADD